VRSNGLEHSFARRNKYDMGEAVRSAGARAVRQVWARDWAEVAAFLDDWKPDPCV